MLKQKYFDPKNVLMLLLGILLIYIGVHLIAESHNFRTGPGAYISLAAGGLLCFVSVYKLVTKRKLPAAVDSLTQATLFLTVAFFVIAAIFIIGLMLAFRGARIGP